MVAEVVEYIDSAVEEPATGNDKKKNRAKAVFMLANMIGGGVEIFVESTLPVAGSSTQST